MIVGGKEQTPRETKHTTHGRHNKKEEHRPAERSPPTHGALPQLLNTRQKTYPITPAFVGDSEGGAGGRMRRTGFHYPHPRQTKTIEVRLRSLQQQLPVNDSNK